MRVIIGYEPIRQEAKGCRFGVIFMWYLLQGAEVADKIFGFGLQCLLILRGRYLFDLSGGVGNVGAVIDPQSPSPENWQPIRPMA